MENQKMTEQNYNSALQLAIDLEGPHGVVTCQQAAAELRRLHKANQELLDAGIKTIEENLHLADGDVCTLIHLKQSIAKARGEI